jgi:uncharacterized protein
MNQPGVVAGTWLPVDAGRRAVTLDVLRGFAILGVLVANTLVFAYPIASSPPEIVTWREAGPLDRLTVLVVGLLVEGKFYTLLSVLFGMGLMLQADRADALNRPFAAFSLRRAGWLFAIGVLHGVLLYAADILAFYALVSMAALGFRRLSSRSLVFSAIACAGLSVAVLTLYAWSHPAHPYPGSLDWARLARGAAAAPGFFEAPVANVMERLDLPRRWFYETMADEVRISREGTFAELTRLRTGTALLYSLPHKVLFLGPMVLAFFLFGMSRVPSASCLGERGPDGAPALFMSLDGRALTAYRRLCTGGISTGLVLVVVASGIRAALPRGTLAPPTFWAGTFVGVFLQSLGYAAGVLLLVARRPDGTLVRGLAAVGRTALSNYLLQSVVLGTLFYGVGLGWFTRLTALPVVALAIPVFALEVWLSRVWLGHYAMGPVEWIWRCLTYGRWLALARAVPPAGSRKEQHG